MSSTWHCVDTAAICRRSRNSSLQLPPLLPLAAPPPVDLLARLADAQAAILVTLPLPVTVQIAVTMRAAYLLLALAAAAPLLPGVAAQRRRVLTDDNFEHTTQAATGQTTGVWFVSFCSPSARACKELAGPWEELGRELLQAQPPAFLSVVDPHASPALAKRFGIATLPTLLLFRDRKARRVQALEWPGSADRPSVPWLLC